MSSLYSRVSFRLHSSLFLSLLLISFALSVPEMSAQIPQTISYQGVVSQDDGRPLPNGTYQIDIALYDSEHASSPIWMESHQASLTKGLFSLALGSVEPFNLPFDRPYWLGIAVDGAPEMPQRTRLSATPYAFRSDVAGSLEGGAVSSINGLEGPVKIVGAGSTIVTEIDGVIRIATTAPKELQGGPKVEIGPGSAQTSTNNKSLIHLNETGGSSPNLIELEAGGSDKFVVQNDGDVEAVGVVNAAGLAISGSSSLGDGLGADDFTVNVGTGVINFSNSRLQNVANPTGSSDAATKDYVDTEIGALPNAGTAPLVTFAVGGTGLTNNRVLSAGTGVTLTDAGVDNGAMSISIGQDVATTAAPTFSGLTVTGIVILPANSISTAHLQNSTIDVAYGAGLSGDASVALGGTLNLANSGVTSLAGTLNQVNVSAATGDVVLSLPQDIDATATPTFGGLTVTGNVTAGQNVAITDDLTVGGELTVTDEVLLLDALTVADDLEVEDDLEVGGEAEIDGGLTVNGGTVNLPAGSIDNAELANASVNVLYGAGLSGDATVALGGTLNLANSGVTSLGGTPNQVNVSAATGDVTLSLPQDIDATATPTFGGLSVTGNVTAGQNVEVTDDVLIHGELTVAGEALILDDVTVDADVEISDDLDVGGVLSVSSDAEVDGDLEVGTDLEVEGEVSAASALLETSGTALEIAEGGVVLSTSTYTANALTPPTISTGTAVALVTAANIGAGDDINVPATGSTGQIIIVTNSTGSSIDLLGTAVGAVAIPDGEGLSILYDGTNWIVVR